MSALPPKADIGTQSWNVHFVPIADITENSRAPRGPVENRFYLATPQAMRAPPPPKGAGWSE